MLVFFSGRRLKPGHWDEFRKAWDPGDAELPDGAVIYHARSVKDENEVISFGIFPGEKGSVDEIRGDQEQARKRELAMDEHVHDVPLEGVYEVVEEIKP